MGWQLVSVHRVLDVCGLVGMQGDMAMSARGMVVQAGSGARQFLVRRSRHGNIDIPEPFPVWISDKKSVLPSCKLCHEVGWVVVWESMPRWAQKAHLRLTTIREIVVCNCMGEFIE
jgi:hypothetical protein